MKAFCFLEILKGLLLMIIFTPQVTFANRDDALIRNFNIDGEPKRLYVEVRDFPLTISDDTIEEWKMKIADWAETYWKLYEGYSFKSPANDMDGDGVEVLKLFFKRGTGESGSAGSTGWIRIVGRAMVSPDIEINVQSVIAHEIFHSVQFRYSDINNRYRNTFSEGTAQLVPSLIIPDLNELVSTTFSCESSYLEYPGGQMWFRPGGSGEANVCSTALWWKYLTQQLSRLDQTGIDHGIDTMARLLDYLETPIGWRQRNIDRNTLVADFNDDDLEDILVTSDLYLGIISPMFFNPTTIGVIVDGGRFGGAWKYQHTDQILGAGDMVGDKSAEFIIKSETHLGIIGMEDGKFKSHGIVSFGNTFGTNGWRVKATDEIVGTGDFDGDGKSEFLIKSNSHLGLVEYNESGFKTLSVRQMGNRLVGGGWVLSPEDEIIGLGNFDNNRNMDFIIKSNSHIGIIGYNSVTGEFKSLGARQLSSIPGNISQINVAMLRALGPDCLVLTQPSGLRIFALGEGGSLEEISNVPNSSLPSGFDHLDALIDMDGDGLDELIFKHGSGSLAVGSLELISNSYRNLSIAFAGVEINDGFNGNEYRTTWSPHRDYQILTSGDLDGDGKDELFIRDGGLTLVLGLDELNGFVIGESVSDNQRFDSLIAKLDAFIRYESRGQRNLHSMFMDFAAANYINSLEGSSINNVYRYSDELRHPGAIDFDFDPDTPPVTFAFEGNVDGGSTVPIEQEPWTSLYFRFNSILGHVDISSSQLKFNNENVNHTLIVVEGNRLISKTQETGGQFSKSLALGSNQNAILIVTSFEAPLSYVIQVTGK